MSWVGGGLFAAAIVAVGAFMLHRRRYKKPLALATNAMLRQRNVNSDPSALSNLENGDFLGVMMFSYDELEEATDYFNPSRELGEGGFGTVYLGIYVLTMLIMKPSPPYLDCINIVILAHYTCLITHKFFN